LIAARDITMLSSHPLNVIDPRTIYGVVCAIEDLVVAPYKSYTLTPRKALLRPLRVRSIVRITGEPCGELEEAAVGDRALADEGSGSADIPMIDKAVQRGLTTRAVLMASAWRETRTYFVMKPSI